MFLLERDFGAVVSALEAAGCVHVEPGTTPRVKTRWVNEGTEEKPDLKDTGEVVEVDGQQVVTVRVRQRTVNGRGEIRWGDFKIDVLTADPVAFRVESAAEDGEEIAIFGD